MDTRLKKEPTIILAGIVLKQAQDRDKQCAFWFISALSKLRSVNPKMKLDDVCEFVAESMPLVAQEYQEYIRNT